MVEQNLSEFLYRARLSKSEFDRDDSCAEFLSDHSRIIFSSSFRRLVKKAQVFSLESNTSVRNRLTHSLEVSDIGRTIARTVGVALESKRQINSDDVHCMISIVENACLMHDIGNPPFGHFGETAIKRWFAKLLDDSVASAEKKPVVKLPIALDSNDLYDLLNFDGNPQGFRIATRLHCERDRHSLNLTAATLLSSVKYPHCRRPDDGLFKKKIGYFASESDRYEETCELTGHVQGKRYFLAYLMELADDCCYCLSDIADSFEKNIISLGQYTDEMKKICEEQNLDPVMLACEQCGRNFDFKFNVAIPLTRLIIDEAKECFIRDIDGFLSGEAKEISDSIASGGYLECLKKFVRRHVYTSLEVQRIELSGFHIVTALLDQFGKLLLLDRSDFRAFVENNENPKDRGLDFEWRLFSRISKRMLEAYKYSTEEGVDDKKEWLARARLIVDFIAGMTDESAKELHQILTGTDSMIAQTAW